MTTAENNEPLKENNEENETKKEERKSEPVMISITEKELIDLKAERDDFKEKYLRALAESENSRKRLIKEKLDHTKFTVQEIVSEFIPPIEQLEKAIMFAEKMSSEVRNWAVGFSMIAEKFKEIIHDNGIMIYHTDKGELYNPHLHEAIELVETHEHPQNTIIEEFAPGYKMGDRVIRPAHVKVAKLPESSLDKEEESDLDAEISEAE